GTGSGGGSVADTGSGGGLAARTGTGGGSARSIVSESRLDTGSAPNSLGSAATFVVFSSSSPPRRRWLPRAKPTAGTGSPASARSTAPSSAIVAKRSSGRLARQRSMIADSSGDARPIRFAEGGLQYACSAISSPVLAPANG